MWIGLSISWSFINRAVIVRGKGILFDLVRESQGILVEVWDYWDYLSKLGRSFPLVISSIYCCFNSLSFFWQFFSFSNFPIIYLQEGSLHILESLWNSLIIWIWIWIKFETTFEVTDFSNWPSPIFLNWSFYSHAYLLLIYVSFYLWYCLLD